MSQRNRRASEHELYLSGDEIVNGLPGPLVRYMHEADAGHLFQQFRREVRRCSVAAAAVVEFAWLRFREVYQLCDGLRRDGWMHDEYGRPRCKHRNRCEIG